MKKFLFLGIGALLAASFTSCKDDVIISEDPNQMEILDSDQVFYVAIDMKSVATRADYDYDGTGNPEFDDGSSTNTKDAENKVESIYLIFYDAAGKRIATTENIISQLQHTTPNGDGFGSSLSKNSLYSGVVQVQARHGLGLPAQVMALVNPIRVPNESTAEFATLEDLVKTTREYVVGTPRSGNADLFAMSKSSFYGEDGSRIIATPITTNMLCTTEDGASVVAGLKQESNEKVDGKEPITIYVERYAAKVNFQFGPNALNGTTSNVLEIPEYDFLNAYTESGAAADADEPAPAANVTVTLKFVPEYWAVNAYERTTFITKSFFETFSIDGAGNISDANYASWEYMNHAISEEEPMENEEGQSIVNPGWQLWNNPGLHRCYWGQSPSYYAKNYPRNADDIMDKRAEKGNDPYDQDDYAGYSLGYYTYNELVENAKDKSILSGKARAFTNGQVTGYKSPAIYVRENTVSGQALRDASADADNSPKAAIASVIITGKYQLFTSEGAPITLPEGSSFYITGSAEKDYRYHKDKDAILMWFYRNINTIISSSNKEWKPIFEINEATGEYSLADPAYEGVFKISHPDMKARGNTVVLDSRFVTLQFNDNANTEDHPLYIKIQNQWYSADHDLANYNLMSAAGVTREFKDGMAFFNIPINHLGFYRAGNPNAGLSPTGKNEGDKKFDWNVVRSGDFGVVRNHSYSIVADEIHGLGNAIPDPNVPIVPPTDPEAYYIGAKIIVLNWAVVPTQHVTL